MRRFLAQLFPNPILATIGLTAAVVEGLLLLKAPFHVYSAGGPIPWLTALFFVWFWFTLSWVIYGLARACTSVRTRYGRWAGLSCELAVGLLATAMLMMHIASWGLYLRTGRFANLEGFIFIAVNPSATIWSDLTVVERLSISLLGLGGVVASGASPWIIRRIANQTWNAPTSETTPLQQPWLTPVKAWQFTTVILLIPGLLIANDQSGHRKMTRMDALKNSVNPPLTLALSGIEILLSEPIEPCLNVADLTPLSAGKNWTPTTAPSGAKHPSVIILAVESLRADTIHLRHQGREVMPHLNRLAEAGVHFTNAYAQSTHSDYADVCIVSSLYPLRTRRHHYYRRADPWPKTLAFDLFKQAGHQTAIISSQNESWGSMDQFLETPNLDLFYDAQRSGARSYISSRDPGFAHEIAIGSLSAGRLEDHHTMDKAIEWVKGRHAADEPFFLSMNFQSSHFPYELPENVETPFQPAHLDSDVTFMYHPPEKTPQVRNAYYNGIHHCDRQIGRMVETLRELDRLDDVILVVLGENGEAFHENGSVGHAREPVEPVIHAATVLHCPRLLTPMQEPYPVQHIDILPTVCGLMNWPSHPNFQGIDVFSSARPPLEDRALYFHVNSAAAQAEAVQLAGRWKYQINHRSGETALYDLSRDPGESTDLTSTEPELAKRMHTALTEWRSRQLAYYHFPQFYESGYPPSAPRLSLWDGAAESSPELAEREQRTKLLEAH
jgi:arylsulfatase A-like enzyme